MPINQIKSEHVRLSMLLALSEEPDYTLNSALIGDVLKLFALRTARDEIHTELAWLERNGYVKINKLSSNTWVATLTTSGLDVAQGNITVPGIKRPSPRS